MGFIDSLVAAADLESELEKAVKVTGYKSLEGNWMFAASMEDPKYDTHSALLIGIEPFKKDTAEDLLRELIELRARVHDSDAQELDKVDVIANKAKALLERGDK